jgi:hypothetical protein
MDREEPVADVPPYEDVAVAHELVENGGQACRVRLRGAVRRANRIGTLRRQKARAEIAIRVMSK